MTQSIAEQPAPELAVPYRIDAEGKERPPLTLKELGARHRPFSTSIGAVGATRTDFQLSRRWFKIPAPSTSGSPVQTAFEGAYVNTRDKLPLDQQRYGLQIPFDHEGRSSLGVLPTTMESRIEVAMLAVQSLIAPLRRCVVGIKSRCSKLIATACDPYRPERHYMRGPDRKWVAKHGVVVDKRPTRERPIF